MPIAPAWREVGSQEGGPVNRTFIICLSGESPQGSQVKTSQSFGPTCTKGPSTARDPLALALRAGLHLGGGGDPEQAERGGEAGCGRLDQP